MRKMLLLICGLMFINSYQAFPNDKTAVPGSYQVKESYNQTAFNYKINSVEDKGKFRILHLSYPSPFKSRIEQNNTVYAEYYLPKVCEQKGVTSRPAVICLHALNTGFAVARTFCANFADNGIPALMLKLPFYGKRRPPNHRELFKGRKGLFLFIEGSGQALDDIRRSVDLLASRLEVDKEKIGLLGVSLGGITAAMALEKEPRFYKGVLLLAGGNLEKIIGHSKETRFLDRMLASCRGKDKEQVLLKLREIDPITNAARLRGKTAKGRVLMFNAEKDEVIPPECSLELAEAMGIKKSEIHWFKNMGHYSALAGLPFVLDKSKKFIMIDMPEKEQDKVKSIIADNPGNLPLQMILIKLACMLKFQQTPSKFISVKIKGEYVQSSGKTISARIILDRGPQNQFKLNISTSLTKHPVQIGRGQYPWMVSENGTVFWGDKKGVANKNVSKTSMDPELQLRFQMIAGMLELVASSPVILDQFVIIKKIEKDNSQIRYHLSDKRGKNNAIITLDETGSNLRKIEYKSRKSSANILVEKWTFPDFMEAGVFQPPPSKNIVRVRADRLNKMFNALGKQIIEFAK